jgi:hypothetical protein
MNNYIMDLIIDIINVYIKNKINNFNFLHKNIIKDKKWNEKFHLLD